MRTALARPDRARDRRQLADQGRGAPDGARPVGARARDLPSHRADRRERPSGRRHARQRPAGRLHPAAIRAGQPRAARGAARLVRRRHAGRDRLHDPAGARQRVPPPRDREAGRVGCHAGRGRSGQRGVHEAISKPIGSFMDAATAKARAAAGGFTVVEDAGRGWRRVVASPDPIAIVETRCDPVTRRGRVRGRRRRGRGHPRRARCRG